MINQLVVGKSYEARNGEIFTIHGSAHVPFENYPYYDKVKKQSWSYKGSWCLGKQTEYDLIREVEKVEEKQELKLKEIETEKMDVITPEEYLRQFRQTTEKMYGITKAKNSDYTADSGDAFANFKVVERLGVCSVETGFLTRMSDKVARLAGLAKGKEVRVKDEKYEDTLIDLANYSILLAIYLRNRR